MPNKTRPEKIKTMQIAGVSEYDSARFRKIQAEIRLRSGRVHVPAWEVFGMLMETWEKNNA